jgi:hypothetical protein
MGCAPSGMRATLFTSKQNKKQKEKNSNKNKLFHVQIKKTPGGLSVVEDYFHFHIWDPGSRVDI